MLLDFFVWDVKFGLLTEIEMRLRVGGSSFVCLAALASVCTSECMWLILKTLRRFGRHISFVWFDSNILQQISVSAVQISDGKVSRSAFRLQYFEFVIVARNYFLSRRKISVDLTSSVIVRCGSFCTAM